VGTGYSSQLVDWEMENGQLKQISIADSMMKLISGAFKRRILPINIIFPELTGYPIDPSDRIHTRNCQHFNNFLQRIMDERRSGHKSSYDNGADLLSILLSSEIFVNDDDLIKGEIFTFFFAGMKTI